VRRKTVHQGHAHLGIAHPGLFGGRLSEAEILADYPQLKPEDIRACLAYAAEIARERIVPVSVKPAA
jgi:hypothetical protein